MCGREPETWADFEDEADFDFRMMIREYLDECAVNDTIPDAGDFLTLYNTSSVTYDYDAVEAEIERALRWR